MCGAERSRSLVFFSFPYPTGAMEKTDESIGIKKRAGAEHRFIGLLCRPTEGRLDRQKDVLYVAFLYFLRVFFSNLAFPFSNIPRNLNAYVRGKLDILGKTLAYILAVNLKTDLK
jgi:hypothetical protein